MTRWTAAFASLLLLALCVRAQEEEEKEEPAKKTADRAELLVPVGAPATIDGAIGEEEWKGSASFEVSRRKDVFGKGFVRRSKRDLLVAYRSDFAAYTLGVRFTIIDPVTSRRTLLLVTPIYPPLPPVAIYREMPARKAEQLAAAGCEVRFDFSLEEGFGMEMRLPLDLLEVARSDKRYLFSVEVWDLRQRQLLAGYPLTVEKFVGGLGQAWLLPQGDWGADEPLITKAPAPHEALDLLEKIETEMNWYRKEQEGAPPEPVLEGFVGDRDGKRRDAPLAALEKRLRALIERYPDYLSLRANLMRVLRGRNRFAGALEVLDTIPRDFPLMKHNVRNALVRGELLFSLGRYDEGLAHVAANKRLLDEVQATEHLTRMFRGLAAAWRMELEIRKQEAARDDLPRVELTTTRGDVVFELFEDDAPNAVANFISLVADGFYDGTRFHWVSGSGRIFGGDPHSRDDRPHNDGFGDPGYTIESEPSRRLMFPFTIAGADKRHVRRSEGSSFVINITPLPDLDGTSTVFGRVIEGHDVVRALEYYDTLVEARVVRKRDHAYTVVKRPK